MKRLVSFLLLAAMLATLCSCGASATLFEKGLESDEVKAMLKGSDDESEGYSALSTGTTIPAETLIDDKGVTLRVTGLGGNLNSPRLYLAIDKGNNTSLYLDVDYAIINGWQTVGSDHAPEGVMYTFHNWSRDYKKFSGYIMAGTLDLNTYGLLPDVYTYETEFTLSTLVADGGDSWTVHYSVSTSASDGTEDTDFTCDGPVLLDAAGVTVQLYSEDVLRQGLAFYLENHSDTRVTVATEDVTLNGEETHMFLAADVLPGLRRFGTSAVGINDLETETLERGDKLDFTLCVYDYEEYKEYDSYNGGRPALLASERVSLTVGES